MAVVLPGPLVSEIRGSIGGTSFHQARAGIIATKKPIQNKSFTQKQSIAIQEHMLFLQAFQNLTFAQKTLWDTFSVTFQKTDKFGQARELTGLNWFESLNYVNLKLALPFFDVPPAHTLPTPPAVYTHAFAFFEVFVFFDPDFNPLDTALYIYATPPISRVTNSLRSHWRLIKIISAGPYGLINITSDWNNYFNLSYANLVANGNWNIGTMVVTILKASGITSPGLIKVSKTVAGI